MRRTPLVALLVMVAACGPGVAAADGDGSETTTSESTDSSESESDASSGLFTVFSPGDLCGLMFRCSSACDVFAQDCPDGEKCTPYSTTGEAWDSQRCVPVLGDLAPGEPCTYAGRAEATDDCDATSMCYDGICRSFCAGDPEDPSCPEPLSCSSSSDDNPVAVCLASCDPLAQDCPTGSCQWFTEQFSCGLGGELEVGEPCGFANECLGGHACIPSEALPGCLGSACCSPFCDLEQPDCMSFPGTECAPWFEPGQAPAGLERVGVCVIP